MKDVDRGDDIVVEPHGKAIAALVDMRHLDEQRRLEADLRETAFICRAAPTPVTAPSWLPTSRPDECDRPSPTIRRIEPRTDCPAVRPFVPLPDLAVATLGHIWGT